MRSKVGSVKGKAVAKKNRLSNLTGPLKIGLTGNIGTGKSAVARMFADLGVPVFSADEVGHGLLDSSDVIKKQIIDEFGRNVISSQSIDRRKLARVVFNDPEKRRRLESILHPEIMKNITESATRQAANGYVVVEVPLLYEAKLSDQFDYVILVKADREVAVERASKKLKVHKEEILRRLNTQIDQTKKEGLADFVITNDGSLDKLRTRVALIHSIISSLKESEASS